MMRNLLLSLATCLPVLHAMAQDGLWSPVSKDILQTHLNGRSTVSPLPAKFELVKLDREMMQQLQKQAPLVKPGLRSSLSPVRISLPLPVSGQSLSGAFTESPVLSDELTKQLTGFNTYELKDAVTGSLQGRLTITSQGVTGLIFTANGSAYISPLGPNNPDVHLVYYVKDVPVTQPAMCGVKEVIDPPGTGARVQAVQAGDCRLRNYRLAIAATGEYTAWAGGTQSQALVYMATLVNDINAIYQRDAGIIFTLVSNNSIVFTDAATDPYATIGFPNGATLSSNQNTINSALGNSGYDLGIVFSSTWNGGIASMGSVCSSIYKGQAAAGLTFGGGSNPTPGPQGPVFIATVAHEMGHQFNAYHTMAGTNGGCNGNATAASAFEPGGGSTIMAYAGTCSGNNYQTYTDLYFHGGSILQIVNYAVNSATCAAPVTTGNSAPTVSVPASTHTIPASTPFMLTATGTDVNNSTLYYSWEQMDAGVTTTTPPSATASGGPNFRSYEPTTSNTRVFPRLQDIVSGAATPYEVLSAVTRAMNFQVMVRDAASGGGCTAQTTVTVNTNAAAGPFTVTSQNAATAWVANGSNTADITWNVANTNAAPINCSNVDILLSTDGGLTFPDTLVANTPNDGTQTITIPSLPTTTGRIMVRSRGNIFFNINTATITITSSCSANGSTFAPGMAVTGAAGSSALDLSLSPVYGSLVNISGTLSATDPAANLTVQGTSDNSCRQFGNVYRYDTYRFTPSANGTYTFTRTSGSNWNIFNLYSDNFTPGNPCNGFIGSSGRHNGSSVSTVDSYTATLSAGQYYTMAVGSFADGNPALPANYTITATGPGGLYSYTPNPGAGFGYTFVIVDNATGLIKAIDASADLSNATNYPFGGNYTVYGLSYSNAVSAATLNAYAGTSFTAFRDAILFSPNTFCGSISQNNALVTITSVLNTQMSPLTAHKNKNAVHLKWTATSSENSSYFEIWRSANGISFNELTGTVPAQRSGSSFDYELNDNFPLDNLNYYRVKHVDKNGQATWGNIASINMQQGSSVLSVYPNPVRSALTLSYNSTVLETIGVRILNTKGSVVYQAGFKAQKGGNQYAIPAGALSKGVYVVQLISSSGSYIARFVKE
jgi:hypothetical protein